LGRERRSALSLRDVLSRSGCGGAFCVARTAFLTITSATLIATTLLATRLVAASVLTSATLAVVLPLVAALVLCSGLRVLLRSSLLSPITVSIATTISAAGFALVTISVATTTAAIAVSITSASTIAAIFAHGFYGCRRSEEPAPQANENAELRTCCHRCCRGCDHRRGRMDHDGCRRGG
jgi:hypothetical protein